MIFVVYVFVRPILASSCWRWGWCSSSTFPFPFMLWTKMPDMGSLCY